MPGPAPAVALIRHAVAQALLSRGKPDPLGEPAPAAVPLVLVACSGGADSLALAAATAFLTARPERLGGRRLRAGAVVVDHAWTPESSQVAATAAALCQNLGLAPVEVVRVDPTAHSGGPEAAARTARYAALTEVAHRLGAEAVLLGHTLDDQAETVLLGLARGAGARSLAGMPMRRGLLLRPLLEVRRSDTEAACAALGLNPWHDPANLDDRYLRSKLRRLMPRLDAELGPGIAEALARSAAMLAEDADALDTLAQEAFAAIVRLQGQTGAQRVDAAVSDLLRLPDAVRHRVLHRMAIRAGSPAGSLRRDQVLRVDRLIMFWAGQGPIQLPGSCEARRTEGRILMTAVLREDTVV